MKKIYLSHPYGGKPKNFYKVGRWMQKLVKEYPDYLFISPITMYGTIYFSVPYEQGMEYCLELLKDCDELWILHNDGKSRGVAEELSFALNNEIPIKNLNKPQ